jgi:hypothetical protein
MAWPISFFADKGLFMMSVAKIKASEDERTLFDDI